MKFSPKKLDAVADDYFDTVRFHKERPDLPVPIDYLEHCELAGLALRRWAQQLRDEQKKRRKAK